MAFRVSCIGIMVVVKRTDKPSINVPEGFSETFIRNAETRTDEQHRSLRDPPANALPEIFKAYFVVIPIS